MALTALLAGTGADALAEQLQSTGFRIATGAMTDLAALAARASAGEAVLVLDVRDRSRLPDLQPVRQAQPGLGIVMVAAALDPALMLDAMRAGVNECVAEPVSAAALEAAIRRVADRHAPAAVQGKVIALVGAKGGVGTTTLATNISTALANAQPGGALLIDLHAGYGDAGLFLGVEPRFSVFDALTNAHRLDEALFRDLVVRSKAGPDVLAAPPALAAVCEPSRLRSLIEFTSRLYRFVVLDCPRTAEILDALDAASSVAVVTSQDLAAVRNAAQLAGELQRRCARGRVMLVVSRFDGAADIATHDVEQATGRGVEHVLPSDYRRCLQALNKGEPLVLANHNRLAATITRLAHDLGDVQPDRGASRGLFERLTNRQPPFVP